jgi:hypothetical protein
VGSTETNTGQRIAAQITTSTPDKPVLLVEIKTDQCRALERAIQATLETRGRKIAGGGTEWFKATRDEVLAIINSSRRAAVFRGRPRARAANRKPRRERPGFLRRTIDFWGDFDRRAYPNTQDWIIRRLAWCGSHSRTYNFTATSWI